MAVFEGTRLRSVSFPAARAQPRRAGALAGASTRSAPRLRPTGLLMAAILTATMLGLVYLTQTLASNAASVQVAELAAEADDLRRRIANQASLIATMTDADDVIERARRQGLVLLDDPLILEAP